jgi:hypothetical protein
MSHPLCPRHEDIVGIVRVPSPLQTPLTTNTITVPQSANKAADEIKTQEEKKNTKKGEVITMPEMIELVERGMKEVDERGGEERI